jgi:RNA polymerase sigma-70 factor, ECF subfamily
MTIEVLLRAIAGGDKNSFETLYRQTQRPMLAYAATILAGDRQGAEDAVDEAFLEIWKKAANFAGHGSGQGWIRLIVRNKAIDWLRKQKADRTLDWSESLDQVEDHNPNAEAVLLANSEHAWLIGGLQQLSLEHREVVVLCYFEERSLSEIAQIMGCPENTVKTRLYHARLKLRAQLELNAQAA